MKLNAKLIRTVLKLTWFEELGQRGIADAAGVGKTTVLRIQKTAVENHITAETIENYDNAALEAIFTPRKGQKLRTKPEPDYKAIHSRISRTKHRSVMHEWIDYRMKNPDGYGYSRFLALYKDWCGEVTVKPKLLANEIPGDAMYVDWAGDTVVVTFPGDKKPTTISFFVTSLGASELIYVEPFDNMGEVNFIQGHINALKYYGGIPRIVVPDNCKTAVIKNKDKEFILQRMYEDMEKYYGYTVIPARPGEPTDKNDVEANVYRAEDYIISDIELNKENFWSMKDVKKMCADKLAELNAHKFRGTEYSRLDWFNEIDKPELRPLPQKHFTIYSYEKYNVKTTYHVKIKGDDHQYSVPYRFINRTVTLKYSLSKLLIYDEENNLIAEWERFYGSGLDKVHTLPEHRPENHQIAMNLKIRDTVWYKEQAKKIGPHTLAVITRIIESKSNPDAAYSACMGILTMAWKPNSKNYLPGYLLEEVCREALKLNSPIYATVRDLAKSKREELRQNNKDLEQRKALPEHENIRDKDNYK